MSDQIHALELLITSPNVSKLFIDESENQQESGISMTSLTKEEREELIERRKQELLKLQQQKKLEKLKNEEELERRRNFRIGKRDGTIFPGLPKRIPECPTSTPPRYLRSKRMNLDFNKLYKFKEKIGELVKEPNIDRSSWKVRAIRRLGVKNIYERINSINRAVVLQRYYDSGSERVKSELTDDIIIELILQHLSALGFRETREMIVREGKKDFPPHFLNDSRLRTLLNRSLLRVDELYDSIMNKPRETSVKLLHQVEETWNTAEEEGSRVIEQLVSLGIRIAEHNPEQDVYIWNEGVDNEKNINWFKQSDERLIIGSASINKLIERLTHETTTDKHFQQAFLMTFPSFLKPKKFLRKLRQRFHVPRSRDLTDLENQSRTNKIQTFVIGILGQWVEHYFDSATPSLIQKVKQFIKVDISKVKPALSMMLLKKIKNSISGKSTNIFTINEAPEPIVPKNIFKRFSLSSVSPIEFARQLTLADYELYSSIRPYELLDLAWSKAKYRHRCPNILEMINRLNEIRLYVATEILSQKRLRDRAKQISRFIIIIDNLLNLNNFNGLMAISGGLKCPPVRRLKFTWEKVKKDKIDIWEKVNKLMSADENYTAYRDRIKGPFEWCIPFIGIPLRDLTYNAESPDIVKSNLINWRKHLNTYEIIHSYLIYQSSFPSIYPIFQIKQKLYDLTMFDEESLFTISTNYEPKRCTLQDVLKIESEN